jgi:NitT/TauT family transport system ATP-binding protein
MSVIIELKGVNKYFQGPQETLKVLEDVSLQYIKGRSYVSWASGCGKSTLLRQIAGFDERDSGRVLMHENEILNPEVKRMMVFQDFTSCSPGKQF